MSSREPDGGAVQEAPGAAAIRLDVLGHLDLRDSSGRAITPVLAQPKRLALLIYLAVALPRGFRQRDLLLAMFWPEHDAARASTALRQALHFLRRHLPAGTLETRGAEQVGVGTGRVICDAVTFDMALDYGREQDALAIYAGELLPGFHVTDAPDFDQWLTLERERLQHRAARAALVLAHREAEQRNAGEASRWSAVAARISPGMKMEPVEPPDVRSSVQPAGEFAFRHPRLRIPSGSSQRNLDALHAYLRGRSLSRQRTAAAMLEAIRHYHRALQHQPDLAEAHVGLAEAWLVLPVYSAHAAADAFPQAKHHAAKAIALDPSLAAAHAWLAHAIVCYEWDWVNARLAFERALQLDPVSVDARTSYALYYLTPTARFTEAMHSIEIARDLDPTSPTVNAYVAMTCLYARQYERAIGEARLALELGETLPLAWWTLGMAQEQSGRLEEAIGSFERAAELTDSSSLMLAQLARAHAVAGDGPRAESLLAEIVGRDEQTGPAPYFAASVLGALGDPVSAMHFLDRAYRERSPHIVFVGVAPLLDPLRGQKRFRELLVRLGLGGLRVPR